MWRISAMVSGATVKSVKRADSRATRRMRTGSSRKAGRDVAEHLVDDILPAVVGVGQVFEVEAAVGPALVCCARQWH